MFSFPIVPEFVRKNLNIVIRSWFLGVFLAFCYDEFWLRTGPISVTTWRESMQAYGFWPSGQIAVNRCSKMDSLETRFSTKLSPYYWKTTTQIHAVYTDYIVYNMGEIYDAVYNFEAVPLLMKTQKVIRSNSIWLVPSSWKTSSSRARFYSKNEYFDDVIVGISWRHQ